MAAPKFTPIAPLTEKWYESPDYVPDAWEADRPGEIEGRQPEGPLLGYQGPDQGYALLLARRIEPDLVLADNERADDAVAGCLGIALRRASMFGRAPVIHDLRIAFTIWGFLDPAPPTDLVAERRRRFEGAADPHHYNVVRELADTVPEATLRSTPQQVLGAYPASWRTLLGLDVTVPA
ncbi:hypothetical protein [Desertimonas flava]|jgi:hypothetical protein|uniref:hypothetical protein n=1 Tax=Desertimonas flava TaxID=2064846 RepID=UPI000E3431AC|nr:hypothetical protein [Desertimonas flava]